MDLKKNEKDGQKSKKQINTISIQHYEDSREPSRHKKTIALARTTQVRAKTIGGGLAGSLPLA